MLRVDTVQAAVLGQPNLSSTALTLLVLPALYVLFRRDGNGETLRISRDLATADSRER
jgi:hypothetical protein